MQSQLTKEKGVADEEAIPPAEGEDQGGEAGDKAKDPEEKEGDDEQGQEEGRLGRGKRKRREGEAKVREEPTMFRSPSRCPVCDLTDRQQWTRCNVCRQRGHMACMVLCKGGKHLACPPERHRDPRDFCIACPTPPNVRRTPPHHSHHPPPRNSLIPLPLS
jgi:hypothetical protein